MEETGRAADGGGGTAAGDTGAAALPRTLPAPGPARRIERPAGAGLAAAEPKRGPGRPRKPETEKRELRRQRERFRAQKRAPQRAAPASAPAAVASGEGRDLAASVFAHHERAARWLGQPVLALTRAEAADVADALRQAGELSGWQPSGPIWGWVSVITTLTGVYVSKLLQVRALAAAAAEQAAAQGRPEPAPLARITPVPPPPPAPMTSAGSTSGGSTSAASPSRGPADDPRLGLMPGLTDFADRFEP